METQQTIKTKTYAHGYQVPHLLLEKVLKKQKKPLG